MIGQELIDLDCGGLIFPAGVNLGRLGDGLEPLGDVPVKDPVGIAGRGKEDVLGKIVVHHELGLDQIEHLGPFPLGLGRHRAFHQAAEGAGEVVLKRLAGFGRHAGGHICSAADNHVGQDPIREIQVELHGDHAPDRVADQDGFVDLELVKHRRYIGRHFAHGIALLRLVRAAVAAVVNGDALILLGKGIGLEVPDIAVGREGVQKHDRGSLTVALIVHVHAVTLDMGHTPILLMGAKKCPSFITPPVPKPSGRRTS